MADRAAEPSLRLVLCWHMHQPDYFDPLGGCFREPWVYLHAIKDYVDMAAHLEAYPRMRAVVNFSPVLLEQIEVYRHDLAAAARDEGRIHDPLLAVLHRPLAPEGREERLILLRTCLRAGHHRLFERFEVYRRLASVAGHMLDHPDEVAYLEDQFFIDLLVWYHLGWLGETVHRRDERVRELIVHERRYGLRQCHLLFDVIRELIDGLLPRYRRLAESGRIELSVTPYSHPILPLLLDFGTARDAWPECPLPASPGYPGGEARTKWQLARAIETFERFFGHRPAGCWPAEGGVCSGTLALAGAAGLRWLASGQGVLCNSLDIAEPEATDLYRPYRIDADGPACFFRDDDLSDAIGFVYRDWHGDEAVADFVHRLERIAEAQPRGVELVVPVILDGENAWEHYPDNGYHFLDGLYRALCDHPRIVPTTFSRCLDESAGAAGTLPRLVAGSWVYGNFSVWIGDSEKNRAWDMLVTAKHAYDEALPGMNADRRAAAERLLALAESSDWFWWLGDDNPEEAVARFEHLFRVRLIALYQALDRAPPDDLAHAFTHGLAHGEGEAMRRAR